MSIFGVTNDKTGNLPSMPGIYPGYSAPIMRLGTGGRELALVQWGLPSSKQALFKAAEKRADRLRAKGKAVDFAELLRMEPDAGTTNVRNIASKHWTRWLGVENRCVVPFNSFAEPNGKGSRPVWFAFDDSRPLACFAGVWVPQWTGVRTIKEGLVTRDLFGFLTTDPNADVGAFHDKAMPVILTTPGEIEQWLTAPANEALTLQRPLRDGSLKVVARDVGQDSRPEAA